MPIVLGHGVVSVDYSHSNCSTDKVYDSLQLNAGLSVLYTRHTVRYYCWFYKTPLSQVRLLEAVLYASMMILVDEKKNKGVYITALS